MCLKIKDMKIRELMEQRKLTQRDLGEKIGEGEFKIHLSEIIFQGIKKPEGQHPPVKR